MDGVFIVDDRYRGEVPVGAIALCGILLIPLGVWWVTSGHYESQTCGMKQALDIPCLTCGSTRATLHLVQGNLLEALRHQPMMMLVYATLTIWGVISLISFAADKKVRLNLSPRVALGAKITLMSIPVFNWIYLIWAGI